MKRSDRAHDSGKCRGADLGRPRVVCIRQVEREAHTPNSHPQRFQTGSGRLLKGRTTIEAPRNAKAALEPNRTPYNGYASSSSNANGAAVAALSSQ
jgi:hypothetical protein